MFFVTVVVLLQLRSELLQCARNQLLLQSKQNAISTAATAAIAVPLQQRASTASNRPAIATADSHVYLNRHFVHDDRSTLEYARVVQHLSVD
jgi:hypothetical protein